jgi:hypothetical protein
MANKLIHKRSSVITDNKPKLPQADGLEFGEIAINYADGYETISFKNTENEIVEVRTREYFEDIINENEEAVSKALNDLNTRVDETEKAYAAADDALKVYAEGLIDGLDIPTNLSELTNDVSFVTLEVVKQLIKEATKRIDGGVINTENTPTVNTIGEITENNEILINEEMLSAGTYTLKYLDSDDNVVNNIKPISNFTI